MEKYLNGSWDEFEQWIRFTIGSDFRWLVRPMDKLQNRQMIEEDLLKDIAKNGGVFPERNSFIERK